MIISPWYSTEVKTETKTIDVHHHNTACRTGQNVHKNHRRYGTDNRPLCKTCAKLDEDGR